MSRDRLAEYRGQGGGGNQYQQQQPNPYAQPYHPQGNRYQPQQQQYPPQQPYQQQLPQQYPQQHDGQELYQAQQDQYELGAMPQGNSLSDFFAEIDEIKGSIRDIDNNVARIETLHARSLNEIANDEQSVWSAKQLDQLITETSGLTNTTKTAIKTLETRNAKLPPGAGDTSTRKTQVSSVKKRFMDSIQRYQKVEQAYRQKTKQRMEREYRIVRPDATPAEVQAAVEDSDGRQIFSQALMSSTRHGEASQALREVQSRHQDILKIEKTITELAQLFNEMSILIEQQDEPIEQISNRADVVRTDVEGGLQSTEQAVKSARAARRKRWYCFGIILLIIVIIVVVVVVVKLVVK